MKTQIDQAKKMLLEWKGDRYAFGPGVLGQTGLLVAELGTKALVVGPLCEAWARPVLDTVVNSLETSGVRVLNVIHGAAPNAPRDDVYRLQGHVLHKKPEVLVAVGGGSTVDACKAAAVLATLGDVEAEIDPYFGVGEVTRRCREQQRTVLPLTAVMTAASSGAHLTKYSNVTDLATGQKKLIVDEAIVPPRAVFDYDLTVAQPLSLSLDGALDGLSHCLEVYLGAKGDTVAKVEEIGLLGMELILAGLRALVAKPDSENARMLIALGTDLGGYAIMVGGTNGPHLNSFSLVKYLTHGRACALMNPYYVAFFAPAVEDRLKNVGQVYRRQGCLSADLERLRGRDLGLAVAGGMLQFNQCIGFPTRLKDIPGITREVLAHTCRAAKDPQLASKLQNMPVPLTSEMIDRYMGSVLEAAWEGDLEKVVNC